MKTVTLTTLKGRKIKIPRERIIFYGTSVVSHLGPESNYRGMLGVVVKNSKDTVKRIWVRETEAEMDEKYDYPWKRG